MVTIIQKLQKIKQKALKERRLRAEKKYANERLRINREIRRASTEAARRKAVQKQRLVLQKKKDELKRIKSLHKKPLLTTSEKKALKTGVKNTKSFFDKLDRAATSIIGDDKPTKKKGKKKSKNFFDDSDLNWL